LRFPIFLTMIFANRDQPIARSVYDGIRIAQAIIAGFVRDPLRGTGALPIELLIGKIRKIDCAVKNYVIAAAVLMDARPSIEIGRIDIGGFAVRRPPDDHLAPAF
jgi:hypothetical protein